MLKHMLPGFLDDKINPTRVSIVISAMTNNSHQTKQIYLICNYAKKSVIVDYFILDQY